MNKSTEKTRSFYTSDLSFLFPCFLSDPYFLCDVSVFVTFAKYPLSVPSPHVTVLSHALHVTTWCSHTLILFCFLLIRLCRSHSPCQSVSHSLINIIFSFLGCLTPHTHFASLVSRTQATRTVMSSMRSWILQLWPPLPAHEAPLTLARGILSSMQPSSLAHTSACHYRPFPSDFGLKVHRPMNSFPRLTPPPPLLSPTWFPCVSSSSAILFPPLPLLC